jgi:hypothetical protein
MEESKKYLGEREKVKRETRVIIHGEIVIE